MKKWMIIATVLTVLGILLCFVGLATMNFDFTRLNSQSIVTKTYSVDTFQSIYIDTDVSNVSFHLSEDGKNKVFVQEFDNMPHSVQVHDGILNIQHRDSRKWYDHIGFFWGETKVELHLSQAEYDRLTVVSHTGKTEVASFLSFKAVEVDTDTGFVKLSCAVTESIRVHTTTGSIEIRDASPASLDVKCSTGKITLSKVSVSGALNAATSTGSITVTDCNAQRLFAECSTGKLTLTNTLAEDMLQAETSTGDITLTRCDAGSLRLKSDTGDIEGTFLTEKIVFAESDTGKVKVPRSSTGGRCDISTDTGDITISF